MPTRSHHWPEGHWDWLIHLPFKHGIRCGEMIYVGGQVDKDAKGLCLNLYDLKKQTGVVMNHINTVLAGFKADHRDVVKLTAFYVNDGKLDESAFRADIARHLTGGATPAITLVPLPWLAYPGMMVEIEAVAMLGTDGRRLEKMPAAPKSHPPLAGPFVHAVRSGEMIHVSAQAPRDAAGKVVHAGDVARQTEVVLDSLTRVLGEHGAGLDDTVKLIICHVSDGSLAGWQRAVEASARRFTTTAPVISSLPVPWLPEGETVRIEAVAMLGRDGQRLPRTAAKIDGHWQWPFPLPFPHGLKCSDMIFVGAQMALEANGKVVQAGDLLAQTHTTMQNVGKVLARFGLTLDDAVKNNTFYLGGAGPDTIVANQRIRAGYYKEPGPASTGVPLKLMSGEGLMTYTEVIAMAR